MDIDRARTFLEIVHTGSFLKASERLHITQTTVSARIRTLEEALGRKLFVRTRNGAALTPAGREFERFAQSFVQVWERARQQLTVPPGRTAVVAVGGEMSLWNPLMLEWLVWMKGNCPHIAVHARVGIPDQLLEQLRTGVLDVAVLYAPKLMPGFRIDLLEEEQLILVQNVAGLKEGEEPDHVRVEWGAQFAGQSGFGQAGFAEPALQVDFGLLALHYILRVGGTGYFRKGTVAPYLAAGTLERVEGAPEFTYPVYAVYAESSEGRRDVQDALSGLKQVSA